MTKRKQQNKDEMGDALKALTVFLVKKIMKHMKSKQIPKNYKELKEMKERLESEEKNRMNVVRLQEEIRYLLLKKKQRQTWKRQENIRKVKKFLHLPHKTWIEQRTTIEDLVN